MVRSGQDTGRLVELNTLDGAEEEVLCSTVESQALAAANAGSTARLRMRTRPTATRVLALLLELPHGDERIAGAVPGPAACPPSVIVVHKEEPVEKDAEDVGQGPRPYLLQRRRATRAATYRQARPPSAHLPRAQALRSRTSFASREQI